MNPRRGTLLLATLIILLSILFGVLIWANYRFSMLYFGGQDFLVQWVAGRTFISSGASPYSSQVQQEIELRATNYSFLASDPDLRFVYPLPAVIFSLPFALIDDELLARAAWLTFQQTAIVIAILVSLRLTGWRPIGWVFFLLLFTTFLGYPIFSALVAGNSAIWQAVLAPVLILACRSRRDELAGMILVLLLLLPVNSFLFVIYCLVWASSSRRNSLLVVFFGFLVILTLIGIFFVPDWLLQYGRILWNGLMRFPIGSPGEAFTAWWPGVGGPFGWVLTILLAIIWLVEVWWSAGKEIRWFTWSAMLSLVISQWIGFSTRVDHFVILIAPMILIFSIWQERWERGAKWFSAISFIILFTWQWLLARSAWMQDPANISLSLFFPFPLFVLVGLYWVRWWAIRPARLFIEELRTRVEI